MRSFWFEPYLWVHLAGIAALPLFLELTLLGLAIGEPMFPAWFELLFVGVIGILPILWMQWQRPFSIFSLVLLALKPSRLTEDQRRILQRFKTPLIRILALSSAGVMAVLLWQLYQIAPVVSPPLFAGIGRGAALLLAAIAFLGSNLFLQVPISVLAVLLTSEQTVATTPPYATEQIAQNFTIPGIRVPQILPPLVRTPPGAPSAASAMPSTASAMPPPQPNPSAPPSPQPSSPVPQNPEGPASPPVPIAAEMSTVSREEFDREEFDEEFDAWKEAIDEEVEIVEELARTEIAEESNLTEDQAGGTMAIADLEDETVAAVTELAQPEQPSLKWLEESSEVTEEVSVPAVLETEPMDGREAPPVAIEPESDPGLMGSEPIQEEIQEENQEEKNSLRFSTTDDFTGSSPTPPTEIVEDTTVVETFGEDRSNNDTDINESEANRLDADELDGDELNEGK